MAKQLNWRALLVEGTDLPNWDIQEDLALGIQVEENHELNLLRLAGARCAILRTIIHGLREEIKELQQLEGKLVEWLPNELQALEAAARDVGHHLLDVGRQLLEQDLLKGEDHADHHL